MRTRNLLLVSLLAALYGCQPETPAQQPAQTTAQPAAQATAQPAAQPSAPPPAAAAPAPVAAENRHETPAGAAPADPLQLAKQYNCMVCHAIDKKVVGPAWKDVADKYRGDAGAEARLMEKIAKGGSGVWGSAVMPPQKVSDADRQALVKFVLSLK